MIIFSHIILCNLLTTILRPNFDDPLDTAQQLVENNIILFSSPYVSQSWKQKLAESSITAYNKLSENFAIPVDWADYWLYSQYLTLDQVSTYA